MAFTEQDALSVTRQLIGCMIDPSEESDIPDEVIVLFTNKLMANYWLGKIDATLEIAERTSTKEMYIIGIKEGLHRASWIANGIRYVGPVASKDTTLVEAYRKVDEEFKSAN